MKKLFCLKFCIIMALSTVAFSTVAFSAETLTPEQQFSVAPDGNFLDAQGKPYFMIGTQQGIHTFARQSGLYPIVVKTPQEQNYIYRQLLSYDNAEKIGFNSVCHTLWPFWGRTLFPNYSGYKSDRPIQEAYSECVSGDYAKLKNLWDPRLGEVYFNYYRNIKMPVYLDSWGMGLSRICRNREDPAVQKLLGGANAFSDFKGKGSGSVFALGLSLGTQQGREVYLKMWRYAAEEMKYEGARAVAYELFNEPKYNDVCKENREQFTVWLEKKYGDISGLNAIYHSDYPDFKAVSKFTDPLARDFPGLAVDWAKFMQDLVIGICEDGKRTIREVDPKARITVQLLGMHQTLLGWHNFDIYRLSKVVDIVNTSTGGFAFFNAEGPQNDNLPVNDTPVVGREVRWGMLMSRIWLSLANGKPLLDGEMYTGPSCDSLHSRIWTDIIRGHNAIYLFSWDGLHLNEKEVKKMPYCMLNPHYFSPDGFKAIKDAKAEVMSVADFFLPRANRAPAGIAMLISYPTIKYDCARNQDGKHSHEWTTSAVALGFSHYQFDAVFEEQLTAKERNLSKYKIIFADNVSNIYPGTLPVLRKFVENGGILVANIEDLSSDDYGNPVKNPLFDVKTESFEGEVSRLARLGAKAKIVRNVLDAKGWDVVDSLAGRPVILKKPLGKGWLYYIVAKLPDYSLAAAYKDILKQHGVTPMGLLHREDRDEVPANVEMHKAVHDGMIAWYLMNCDSFAKIVRLKDGGLQKCAALDPFNKKSLEIEEDTLTILLPPLKRTVVISGPGNLLEKRFGKFPLMSKDEMRAKKIAITEKLARSRQPARVGTCLNLDAFCNKGFDNQQNWPADSAWFDAQHKYLIGVPWHINVFDKVKCQVIRMDFNDNKTCIALKSENLPDGLPEVENIPIGEKVKSISFFQAVTHGKPGEKVMTYKFGYSDGSTVEAPVVVGENIGDWNIEHNNEAIKKMVAWNNPDKLGFFRWEWINPNPQKALIRMSAVSAGGQSTPIIVGITTHPADREVEMLTTFENWKFSGNGHGKRTPDGYELFQGCFNLTPPGGKALVIPSDILDRAVLRFSLNNRPDQWGNRKKLQRTSIGVGGTNSQGRSCTTGTSGAVGVMELTKKTMDGQELDSDPDTWQEISVPLKVLTATLDGSKTDNVSNITNFWLASSQNNDCVLLIRDLRIEY